MTAQRVIVPEMDLGGIIAESRDVAQALNSFADDLERIQKKYMKLQESNRNLCDSCKYKGCWLMYQYDAAKNHCDYYKGESEE